MTGLITNYINAGVAASRPATPSVASGSFGFYYATDTGIASIYAGGSWNNVTASTIAWGAITGSISSQSDLSSALSAKAAAATTITAGTGLSGGGDLSTNRTISLANTAVSAGSYTLTSITVDAQGRLTAASSGALTGDVTTSGLAATIANDAVTYAKIQNVSATSRFLGRISSGAGDVEELTGTQATTLLDVFSSTLKGVAPASGGGTANFLRADGSWAVPAGTAVGTVITTGSPASGNLTKFSGATSITNGDLSGDVTTSGTLATTIANDAVTYAKMQNVSNESRVLGRGQGSGSGDVQELTLGGGLSMSGGVLSSVTGSLTQWDFVPPSASGFTKAHWSGSADVSLTDDSDEGLLIEATSDAASSHQVIYKTISSGAAFDLKVKLKAQMAQVNFSGYGLFVWSPSDNKVVWFGSQTNARWTIVRQTDAGVFSSSPLTIEAHPTVFMPWIRIASDGTTITCYLSSNGKLWSPIGTETVASYVGTAYTRVGILLRTAGSTPYKTGASVPYWSLT